MTWVEKIERAEKRGWFTKKDKDLAQAWVTCACGKQDIRIPRYLSGLPKDETLIDLGNKFACNVYDNDFIEARTTVAKIEVRAREILAGVER